MWFWRRLRQPDEGLRLSLRGSPRRTQVPVRMTMAAFLPRCSWLCRLGSSWVIGTVTCLQRLCTMALGTGEGQGQGLGLRTQPRVPLPTHPNPGARRPEVLLSVGGHISLRPFPAPFAPTGRPLAARPGLSMGWTGEQIWPLSPRRPQAVEGAGGRRLHPRLPACARETGAGRPCFPCPACTRVSPWGCARRQALEVRKSTA